MTPIMRPFLAILTIIISSVFASCNFNCVPRSGREVAETRNVPAFKRLELSGAMKVYIRQSSNSTVNIEADENVIKHIKTRVSGGTLEIDPSLNICDGGEIKVYVTTPSLEGLTASGAVEVDNGGLIMAKDFKIHMSGTCKIKLNLETGHLESESSGAAELTLSGKAAIHDVEMSGACSLSAFGLKVARYNISTSGACGVKVSVDEELNVSSSGAGQVEYKGNPRSVNNKTSGASSVTKAG